MTPGELERAIGSLLQRPVADTELRTELEKLAVAEVSFPGFTWFYGPVLYRRNRILYRPFLLSNFSTYMVLPKWKVEVIAWKGAREAALEAWLAEADRLDDAELFRRLYEWKLSTRFGRGKRDARNRVIGQELQRRFATAGTPARRQVVLRKFEIWFELEQPAACALYSVDPPAAGPFLLRRLRSGWLEAGPKRVLWKDLLRLADERQDEAFRWKLYRRQVPIKDWIADGLAVCQRVRDPAELDKELERRHPEGWGINLADGFLALVQQRGSDLFPYIVRHLRQVWGGWFGRGSYGKMADYARAQGWWGLWAALIRTCGRPKEFSTEVLALVQDRSLTEQTVLERLRLLAGVSREWNFPGFGLAMVQPLDEPVALAMYERFPELLRGVYRTHIQGHLWGGTQYPRLIERFIAASDEEMVDLMASRVVTRYGRWGNAQKMPAEVERLAAYYSALKGDEVVFSRRAARVLGQVPAYSIFGYHELVRQNPLARLLFERSAAAYLADRRSIADLVEGAEIHVMSLAYRALGLDDDRARAQAANHLTLLLGTLLRPLQRDTRALAFGALANAANSPETARLILDRARDAQNLPDTRYPKEALLGLIARLLHCWPELRGAGETPVIYERAA